MITGPILNELKLSRSFKFLTKSNEYAMNDYATREEIHAWINRDKWCWIARSEKALRASILCLKRYSLDKKGDRGSIGILE